jgi:hypothetical protein
MPTFIDESGDTGLDLDAEGTSPYFVVTAVWFETQESLDLCLDQFRQLRQKFRFKERDEFKFSKVDDDRKQAFFEFIASHSFSYAACYLDKTLIAEDREWHQSTFFFSKIFEPITQALGEWYRQAEQRLGKWLREFVQYDQCLDTTYQNVIQKGFRAIPSTIPEKLSIVHKVNQGKSNKELALQIADMICGAIRESIASNQQTYRRLIRKKEICVTMIPEKETTS